MLVVSAGNMWYLSCTCLPPVIPSQFMFNRCTCWCSGAGSRCLRTGSPLASWSTSWQKWCNSSNHRTTFKPWTVWGSGSEDGEMDPRSASALFSFTVLRDTAPSYSHINLPQLWYKDLVILVRYIFNIFIWHSHIGRITLIFDYFGWDKINPDKSCSLSPCLMWPYIFQV